MAIVGFKVKLIYHVKKEITHKVKTEQLPCLLFS